MFARRCVLPAVLLCIVRGDGGCNTSNRAGASYLGESGDCGRMAGEGRGEGILWVGVIRGEREGERPLEGAVLEICFVEPETMFALDMQASRSQSFS